MKDIVGTETFRFSAIASGLFGAATLLLFAFIYWQTAGYERVRIDHFLLNESSALAHETPGDVARYVDIRYPLGPHRISFAGLFDSAGRRVAGDIPDLPRGLRLDAAPHAADVTRPDGPLMLREIAIMIGRRLPGGDVLVVGRSQDELAALRADVGRALALGLIPGIGLALAGGLLLGRRSLARIRALNTAIARIVDGNVEERLPVHGSRDAVDKLAVAVNSMLDEIERLMREISGVGDDIAHDLRTPLTRLRARLEGGLRRSTSKQELEQVIEAGIADLDQSFQMITALLRIGEIAGTRRRAGFAEVSLDAILREAADLYVPVAEQRRIALSVSAAHGVTAHGDRDLLFEAVTNLVDNAVKFTPPGGAVSVSLLRRPDAPVIRVADTGPGIAPCDRQAVRNRFYRADKSRHVAGHGLGLSIVTAILRLHGFTLAMTDLEPGFAMDIVCHDVPHPES
jgi:signal transduction histidine kinase